MSGNSRGGFVLWGIVTIKPRDMHYNNHFNRRTFIFCVNYYKCGFNIIVSGASDGALRRFSRLGMLGYGQSLKRNTGASIGLRRVV